MILDKNSFESALQQDIQQSKGLFGPPVNLTQETQPVVQFNQPKTKRELLWEQKMKERASKPVVVPSMLDQMNPANRPPSIMQSLVQVPKHTPPQLERPKQQVDIVQQPPVHYMESRKDVLNQQFEIEQPVYQPEPEQWQLPRQQTPQQFIHDNQPAGPSSFTPAKFQQPAAIVQQSFEIPSYLPNPQSRETPHRSEIAPNLPSYTPQPAFAPPQTYAPPVFTPQPVYQPQQAFVQPQPVYIPQQYPPQPVFQPPIEQYQPQHNPTQFSQQPQRSVSPDLPYRPQPDKKKEYLQEWQQAIKDKADRKKQEKLQELEMDAKIDWNYNPFGRAGAGAPNRKSIDPQYQQQQQQYQQQQPLQPQYQQQPYEQSIPQQYQQPAPLAYTPPPAQQPQALPFQAPPSSPQKSKFLAYQDQSEVELEREQKKKILQQNLLQQMEEQKRKKDLEKQKKKDDEAIEEARIKKEREELELKWKEEQSQKEQKQEKIKQENQKLIQERQKEVPPPKRKARPIPSQDPFMQGPPVTSAVDLYPPPNNDSAPFTMQQPLFQHQEQPTPDHSHIVSEISTQLKENFNQELERLRNQMQEQQQSFQRQLQSLKAETGKLNVKEESAEEELLRLRHELMEQRQKEQQQHEQMMKWQKQQERLNLRPVSGTSQRSQQREDSRQSQRSIKLQQVEQSIIQPQRLNPKQLIVNFEPEPLQSYSQVLPVYSKKPPLPKPVSRDTTLDFLNALETEPYKPLDYAMNYSGFEFPSKANKFLKASPNQSTVSHQSNTSVNLELVNQRNQQRLARLEKQDLDNSAFKPQKQNLAELDQMLLSILR